MAEPLQREQVYFVLTGPMGVGKSRTGHELVQGAIDRVPGMLKALDLPPQVWGHGYLPSASSLPKHEECEDLLMDDVELYNVLAHALVASLCPKISCRPGRIDFDRVCAGIMSSLKCDCVLLHVDEYATNPFAVRMMMRACALTSTRVSKTTLRVHMVVTGVESERYLYRPIVSNYRVTYEKLLALPCDALNGSVARLLKIENSELFDKCTSLQNLIMDCGGFPGFIERLVITIEELEGPLFQQGLVEGRELGLLKAKAIYNGLVASIARRYGEAAWAMLIRRKMKEEPTSQTTRKMLKRIVLDVITGARVNIDETIYEKGDHCIHYGIAGTTGLIAVVNHQAKIPPLAICAMNEYLKVVDGDALKNPFVYGFQIHEQLALVSLQARLRQMNVTGVKQCTLAELRPGAQMCGDYGGLLLNVPQGPQEDIAILQVATLFEKNSSKLRVGDEGKGDTPPETPGTLLMAAKGQKSVDGALYLEGTYKSETCRVLLLSHSKWSQRFYTGSASPYTSVVKTPDTVQDIFNRMQEMKHALIGSWFGGFREISEQWFFIYDIFTCDWNQGTQLDMEEPDPSTREAVMVTTDSAIASVVGPVLGARSRLKRIAEDEEVFESNHPKRRQQ